MIFEESLLPKAENVGKVSRYTLIRCEKNSFEIFFKKVTNSVKSIWTFLSKRMYCTKLLKT